MASWSVAVRLDKDRPSANVVVDSPGNGTSAYEDFWDETFRRYNSGIVKITTDSVTLSDASAGPASGLYYTTGAVTPVYTSGETLALAVQPAVYNPVTDTQFLNSGIQVVAGALGYTKAYNGGASIHQNYCAVNYGRPGPSAILGPDGTVRYTVARLDLSSNAFTDITSKFTATVAGTITFTSLSPYADIGSVGGGSYSLLLCAGPQASRVFLANSYQGQWGQIGFPVVSGFASVAVQIQKITSVYFPGPTPDGLPPVLQISKPGGARGQELVGTWNLPLSPAALSTHTLNDLYTMVCAANSNLIDANAVQVGSVDVGVSGSTLYNLLNCGILMPDGAGCSVGVKIDYKIAKAA